MIFPIEEHLENLCSTLKNSPSRCMILTAETGAGKSIILGSLGLALGDRADYESIRTGAESALVELSVTSDDERDCISKYDNEVFYINSSDKITLR